MNCLIDNVLMKYLRKGKKIEVTKRYMELRYQIIVDLETIKKRIKANHGYYKIS